MAELIRRAYLWVQAIICIFIMSFVQKYLFDDYDIFADDYDRAMCG